MLKGQETAWRVMLATIIAVAVVSFTVCIGGCSMSGANSKGQSALGSQGSVAWEWQKGIMPTDNQLRVAKNLGADTVVLERMKSEGMSRSAYYHVVPAEAAEEHMGAKYGISFRATDAAVDSDEGTNGVRVTVEPEEGDYAKQAFTVRVEWAEGYGPHFSENYFQTVRGKEYSSFVESLLKDAIAACPHDVCVIAELGPSLFVDEGYDEHTPIADVASSCDGRLSVVFAPASDMDERAYRSELAAILKATCDVNPSLFYEAGYVEKLAPIDKTFDDAVAMSYLYATSDVRRALCTWKMYGRVSDNADL